MDFGAKTVKDVMKTINKPFKRAVLFCFLTLICTGIIYSQDKESTVKNIVEARYFVFHAQIAMPMSGSSRQLTSSDFDLKITKDSVVSYLPYYGRAYSVSYGTTDGGLDFISTKFDYTITDRKKGGWEINIKPKDVQDFREFTLTLSENGNGSLEATSTNRQPISFTGYVTEVK